MDTNAKPVPPAPSGSLEESLPALDGHRAAVEFLLTLGKALHQSGASTHRLEEMLGLVAERLGVPFQLFSLPTGIFAAYGPLHDQKVFLIRVEPGTMNLERIVLLDQTAAEVIQGQATPAQGTIRVREILAMPPRYGPGVMTLSYCLFSAAVSLFFDAGWREVLGSAAVGLVTGLLALAAARSRRINRLFELLASLLAGVTVAAANWLFGPVLAGYVVMASGLIVLMPGLMLTTAVIELANRHLAAGTSRLAGAGLVFLALTLGTALGRSIGGALTGADFNLPPESLPSGWLVPAIVVAALALTVLFEARPRDGVWIVAAAGVAVGGYYLAAQLADPAIAAFLAAFGVGVSGNLFARWRNQPSIVFIIPGITFLVPGVLGYRGLAAMLEHDVVRGIEAGFMMAITAIALVGGLLFAHLVVLPRGSSAERRDPGSAPPIPRPVPRSRGL